MNQNLINMIKNDCEEQIIDSTLFSKLQGQSILITGGTGFVGSWLAEMLTYLNDAYNFKIKIFLLSQRALNFSVKAPHLAIRKDIVLIEKDVRNVIEMPEEISYIIHAAGNPDNRLHASDPLRVMHAIYQGTDAMLAAASRLLNLKKFLNISSGLIYGPQPKNFEGIPEHYHGSIDCGSVASIYGEAKRCAETLCSAYRSQYKMDIVTARPFAFIGPYQLLDKPWAINNFVRDSLMGGPIRILGDGQTVRSYMYPSDLVFWLLRILVDGKPGLAYNVGSSEAMTLHQLADVIADNFAERPKITSRLAGDVISQRSRFVPNVTLAQNSLGLYQKVNINEAIKRTLLWFKESGINFK